ncbi:MULTISPECIES: radical SAM protein [Clostridium]|uniref:Radical SAM protein n=1 Tax=Clostridium aquiflavi TaxID=3073603 RepID=A0ABU1EHI0_9CLOT|nr:MULTISPECIES: radical SAM protein [unclassified Clostridium]MDR5587847.1 radical SAM protein [Clostridium sp. 5N-1]NFG61410.1 radical SAM protein [Clostridium botulinum]NFQ10392.1 radical SAM protein [Clostridium botulinum]
MNYDKIIYRPPIESNTLLLQVTSGCSHNSCAYCNMYKNIKFQKEDLNQIEEDLKEASRLHKDDSRIYLLNGDPFILNTEELKNIAILIRKYLPKCKTIAMYASIKSIKLKTIDELKELRKLGINDLYIGLESGNDEVLLNINKGNASKDALEQLRKLDEAGIGYYCMVMTGVAGAGKGIRNATDTAKLLNKVNSKGIFPLSLILMSGTKLNSDCLLGKFKEATELERLVELRTLIKNLNVNENTLFSSKHESNFIQMSGKLPRDKEEFIKRLDIILENYDEMRLKFEFNRNLRSL